MKKATKESIKLAGYISRFLNEYAPTQKTNSSNTLRSYQNAFSLFPSLTPIFADETRRTLVFSAKKFTVFVA